MYLTKKPGLPKLKAVFAIGTSISIAPETVNVHIIVKALKKKAENTKPGEFIPF